MYGRAQGDNCTVEFFLEIIYFFLFLMEFSAKHRCQSRLLTRQSALEAYVWVTDYEHPGQPNF